MIHKNKNNEGAFLELLVAAKNLLTSKFMNQIKCIYVCHSCKKLNIYIHKHTLVHSFKFMS